MKKFFIFCALIAASFAVSCCPSGTSNTSNCQGCGNRSTETYTKDTLFGGGYIEYYQRSSKDGNTLMVRDNCGKFPVCSSEYYYGGHKYITLWNSNAHRYIGTVHAPDCWCQETHRDTVVIVHNNTEYLTISKKEIDSIVKKSIEKNMEDYFQKLKETNYEKVVSVNLGGE